MKKFPARLEFESVQAEILDETIDESTKDRTMKVQVKWQHGGIINGNGRKYKTEILQREIDRLQEAIQNREIYGASYHPERPSGEAIVNDVSHVWSKIWMDKDGQCYGECTVLPTRTGKDAQVLIKHGRLGVSSRGAGTLTRKAEVIDGKRIQYDEVNEDFRLISPGDFVLSPSVPNARVRAVMEDSISDAVTSYISENKHLFTETQEDKPEDSESNNKEVKMDKYETIEALKADHEELFKSYEDGLNATITTQVDEAVAKVKTELETGMQEAVNAVKKTNEELIEGIRDSINVLTNIPGVIPEEADAKPEGDEDSKTKEEALEDEIKALKASEAELKADIEARKTAETDATQKAEHQTAMTEALNTELSKEENSKFKTMLEEEFIVDAEVTGIESVEDVPEAVKTARERISKIVAEGVKAKILESGMEPKGTDKPEDELTAEEAVKRDKARFTEARKSGFKGTFEQYKANVLKS